MNVSAGKLNFEWIDNWAHTPDSSRENGRTHGVAEASNGLVYVFHQSIPAVLVFDQRGELIRSFGDDFPNAHGLRLVKENGVEYLWLTDEGGRVAKLTLTGETIQTIEKPPHLAYETLRYVPTWVDVNPTNGDIWVADGYGANLIHRYDRSGEYLASLSGEETDSEGKFACPHSIYFDTRGGKEPELYVADRGNRRVQVFDGEGQWKRMFGQNFLVHPCDFAAYGNLLYVPELFARIAVLDIDDQLVGYIGQNEIIVDSPGWPNVSPNQLSVGKFNSPHGVGTGSDGSVYIVEWILGGRITRLKQS